MFAALAALLLFVAFLLLLLVTLSVPIIKSIFLFRLTANLGSSLLATGANATANFGVWGYCIPSINFAVMGIDRATASHCSGTHLGYTLDSDVANALHATNFENVISRTTTAALVLHPIAAALTLFAFLISLFIFRLPSNATSRLPAQCILSIGLLAVILTTVVFLIDVGFVAVVRSKVHDASRGHLALAWGNAVWMTLGATIALWLAMIQAGAAACACGLRSRSKQEKF
ncbi:putative SUR7/PalI family protein [Lyophyllum shimeji]|uniref:SUR7/PalI family protein n=1 Tax=Lyophyllum shimeji TaxID=47721 RepID=A0A9P3PGN9_LYOSH|nr:putative SUR7/PalI family protein [Lyophyllum shimeji]